MRLLATCLAVLGLGTLASLTPSPAHSVTWGAPAIYYPLLVTSARASGMGEVTAILSEGSVAAWRNPGALAFADRWQHARTSTHLVPDLWDDISLKSWTVSGPVPRAPFGLALAYGYSKLDFGRMSLILESGEVAQTFSSYDEAFTIALAARPLPFLGVGVAFEKVYSKLSDPIPELNILDGDAEGKSVSLGLALRTTWTLAEDRASGAPGRLVASPLLGASILHWGGDLAYNDEDQAEPLWRQIHVGGGFRLAYEPRFRRSILDLRRLLAFDMTLGAEAYFPAAGSFRSASTEDAVYHYGIEISSHGIFSVRLGYVDDDDGDIHGSTHGFGVALVGILPLDVRFDWASVPQSAGLAEVDRAAVSINLDPRMIFPPRDGALR